jgi:hypothetical protein
MGELLLFIYGGGLKGGFIVLKLFFERLDLLLKR